MPGVRLPDSVVSNLKSPEIIKLIECFNNNNFQIRIVGGAVRDILLGKVPNDVDFSTNATPDQICKILSDNQIKPIKTGLKHGTITAHINRRNFEITTLRVDTETDGRRAVVQYIEDWKLDASRRDLTINAMSMSVVKDSEAGYVTALLHDYYNGMEDLQNKKVRFVGNSTLRIREDYLRIMRYFRFLGRFGCLNFELSEILNKKGQSITLLDIHQLPERIKLLLDIDTFIIIANEMPSINKVSAERIWQEFRQILIGPQAPQIIFLMLICGFFQSFSLPSPRICELLKFEKCWKNYRKFLRGCWNGILDPSSNFVTQLNRIEVRPEALLSYLIYDSTKYIPINDYKEIDQCLNLPLSSIISNWSDKLKMSKKEKSTIEHILYYIAINPNSDIFYKIALMENRSDHLMLIKETFLFWAILTENFELAKKCVDLNLPKFPVNGNDVISMTSSKKQIASLITDIRSHWANLVILDPSYNNVSGPDLLSSYKSRK